MRYAILCYDDEAVTSAWTKEEDDAVMARLDVVHQRITDEGKLGPAIRLLPTTSATTLRKAQNLVVDGPYAETKEQLLGFYIVDVESLEEGLQIALELITNVKTYHGQGVHGIHLMPVGWDEVVPRLVMEDTRADPIVVDPRAAAQLCEHSLARKRRWSSSGCSEPPLPVCCARLIRAASRWELRSRRPDAAPQSCSVSARPRKLRSASGASLQASVPSSLSSCTVIR